MAEPDTITLAWGEQKWVLWKPVSVGTARCFCRPCPACHESVWFRFKNLDGFEGSPRKCLRGSICQLSKNSVSQLQSVINSFLLQIAQVNSVLCSWTLMSIGAMWRPSLRKLRQEPWHSDPSCAVRSNYGIMESWQQGTSLLPVLRSPRIWKKLWPGGSSPGTPRTGQGGKRWLGIDQASYWLCVSSNFSVIRSGRNPTSPLCRRRK